MNCFFDSEFYGLLESCSVFTTITSWSGCKAGESGDKYNTCPSIRFVTLTCKKSIKLVSWIIEDIYVYQYMFGYLCLHMIRSLLGLLVLPFSFMSRLHENFMVCVSWNLVIFWAQNLEGCIYIILTPLSSSSILFVLFYEGGFFLLLFTLIQNVLFSLMRYD